MESSMSYRWRRPRSLAGLLVLAWANGCTSERTAGSGPLDASPALPDARADAEAPAHLCDLPALATEDSDAPVLIDGTYEVVRSDDVRATLRARDFEETVVVPWTELAEFPRAQTAFGIDSLFSQLTDCLSGCLDVSPGEVAKFSTTDLASPRPFARVLNMASGYMDLTVDSERWTGLVDASGAFAMHWPEPTMNGALCALSTRWFMSGKREPDGTLLAKESICADARCAFALLSEEEKLRLPEESVLQLVRDWRFTPREVPSVPYDPLPLDADAEPLP
jgi:hypothetical protein